MTGKPTQSRKLALACLVEILEKGANEDRVLALVFSKNPGLSRRDRALITRITQGVTERLLTLDAVIGACSKVAVKDMKPVVREVLRLSVYQILYLDRVPDRAAVSEAVSLVRARGLGGLAGFVNGVLRKVCDNRESFVFSDWERKYSVPSWITDRFLKDYGPEKTERMLAGFLEESPLSLHVALSRTSREEAVKSLRAQGVTVTESAYSDRVLLLSGFDSVEKLAAFREGLVFVQDLSSSLVGEAADLARGAFVIDVCAAPGGKSLDAADRLFGSGQVLACDLTEEKVGRIRENRDRLHLKNLIPVQKDALVFDESLEGKADLVLADLPCSGFGLIGKKPDIKWKASEEKCRSLVKLQREILSVAVRYVRPGGRLIYSTCTVNREENEGGRSFILERFPFRPVPLKGFCGSFSESRTLREGYLQLLPGVDPCDGFFLSVFEREM